MLSVSSRKTEAKLQKNKERPTFCQQLKEDNVLRVLL